ncbi:hypothetical protein B0H14DRAFT_2629297 [Mycena olivaceomarginata]|nr:hypothetical protein B0H14DRAFT_2629297 [Mycena olivaceomarginata]
MPSNAAVAADALRVVAVALGFKRVDSALEGIAADLGEVLGLTRASILSSGDHEQDECVATRALDAAEVLMRTVQEQAADIATLTTRLEDDLRAAGQRVITAAEVPPGESSDALGPPQSGPAFLCGSGSNVCATSSGTSCSAGESGSAHPTVRGAVYM